MFSSVFVTVLLRLDCHHLLFDCGVKKENLYDWKRETIQSSGKSGFISWKRKGFALLLSQDGEFVLLGVHLLDPDVFFYHSFLMFAST